jgi:hypothetical protein
MIDSVPFGQVAKRSGEYSRGTDFAWTERKEFAETEPLKNSIMSSPETCDEHGQKVRVKIHRNGNTTQ